MHVRWDAVCLVMDCTAGEVSCREPRDIGYSAGECPGEGLIDGVPPFAAEMDGVGDGVVVLGVPAAAVPAAAAAFTMSSESMALASRSAIRALSRTIVWFSWELAALSLSRRRDRDRFSVCAAHTHTHTYTDTHKHTHIRTHIRTHTRVPLHELTVQQQGSPPLPRARHVQTLWPTEDCTRVTFRV